MFKGTPQKTHAKLIPYNLANPLEGFPAEWLGGIHSDQRSNAQMMQLTSANFLQWVNIVEPEILEHAEDYMSDFILFWKNHQKPAAKLVLGLRTFNIHYAERHSRTVIIMAFSIIMAVKASVKNGNPTKMIMAWTTAKRAGIPMEAVPIDNDEVGAASSTTSLTTTTAPGPVLSMAAPGTTTSMLSFAGGSLGGTAANPYARAAATAASSVPMTFTGLAAVPMATKGPRNGLRPVDDPDDITQDYSHIMDGARDRTGDDDDPAL